ncbi:MAG: UDP-N-acetylmuramoyl-L-alanine--D-glutamate ligase [Desulfobacteraceae bacterium]|nr:UDP-N-acetylmuramoyl-L-alanine--D-glutamate ligase [Desulfobacteraceae bacterium]
MQISRTSYLLVLGLGRSGLSMARFLAEKGYKVKATDIDERTLDAASELNRLGIDTQIGFHDQNTFNRADAIVVSPGIPLDMPYLLAAASHGVPLVGDLDIFTRYNQTPVVAITGTNGKTTVTTLVRDMLESAGISTFMGGNIGIPLVEYLMSCEKVQVVVAEISSFQLDLAIRFTPEIAVLLNLAQDHLDRYEDMAGYARSKWSIFQNQTQNHTAIINAGISDTFFPRPNLASVVYEFGCAPDCPIIQGASIEKQAIDLILPEKFRDQPVRIDCGNRKNLPGTHNLENIAAAALASLCAGADPKAISSAVNAFAGLPHRLQFVTDINGIRFYNDSKATNTDAVSRALECFEQRVVLILGGRKKDTDFTQLVTTVKHKVGRIIAMGEAAPDIVRVFSGMCKVTRVPSMKEAVKTAFDAARPTDVVLLSPACASFDMYDNYAARGDDFTARVMELELIHHG